MPNAKMKIAHAMLAVTKIVARGFPDGLGDAEYLSRLTPTQDNLNTIELEARKDERQRIFDELNGDCGLTTTELRAVVFGEVCKVTAEFYDCDEHGRHEGFLCPDCGKGGKTITESFID